MKFVHPDKLDVALVDAMRAYEDFLEKRFPSFKSIEIHNDWADAGHTADSQHYLGKACDFHVVGVSPLEAWLALERFPAIMGIGFYPDWKPISGFHADVRSPVPFRARWVRRGTEYLAFDLRLVPGITV